MTARPPLTAVRLRHVRDQADAWLRFGEPIALRRRGRHAIAFFEPGAIFAYVDWRAGDYGTITWRLAVLRAGVPDQRLRAWPGVFPGAELLLGATGEAAVRRAFTEIDAVELAGREAATIGPDHWRCAANRIATRLTATAIDDRTLEAASARAGLLA